jgi:hypothetical protein
MLIAVDTNVPLDLAGGVEDVVDGLEVIWRRIAGARLITPPTVNLELAYLSQFALQDSHVVAPIIATPREIVRKFCH